MSRNVEQSTEPYYMTSYQGCALRKITGSPWVSNYDIQGAQHKAYMKKNKFIWSLKGKS